MSAFVLPVRNLLLSVVVHGHSEGDEPGTDDVGIDPHRDSVVGAPIFPGNRAAGAHMTLAGTPGSRSGIGRGDDGTNLQRMRALVGACVRQSHLSLTAEGPVGEIFHAVQQT